MEYDPYKILDMPKNYTLEQLRSQFKKIAITVHPDKSPGNSDYMFKLVTRSYKHLLDELNRKNADKQYNELKMSFKKHQDENANMRPTNVEYETNTKPSSSPSDIAKRFNLERFNSVFEKNRGGDVTDVGYEDWMKKNEIKDAPKLQKNISSERFNEQFDKYVDTIKDKNNKQIIRFKEPEPMMMSNKLNFIELGLMNIDDFSGENKSSRGLNYMDYRVAHSTTRLVDPSNVKKRVGYNSLEDIERERGNKLRELSTKELLMIEKRKQLEEEKERKKVEYQKLLDEVNFEKFKKMNKMMMEYSQ